MSPGGKDFCVHSIHPTVEMEKGNSLHMSVFSDFSLAKLFPGSVLELVEEDPKSPARNRKTP